jgi:hypothetical protein
MMGCKSYEDALAESFFGEKNASVALTKHLAECAACAEEAKGIQATMDLMNAWEAPEPSPYFDQKMAVLLREEQTKAPAGWLERIREYLLLSTGRQLRPAFAGALGLVLLFGGGGYVGVTMLNQSHDQGQASATVNDLQILDRNDQAIQQMDQLLDDDGQGPDGSDQPAS